MMKEITADNELTIKIKCYDYLPSGKYLAWLEGKNFQGFSVTSDSIKGCLEELAISLHVTELYRKNSKPVVTKDSTSTYSATPTIW